MAHRLAPQARADLDDIWEYIASESGDMAIADRVIDAISARFMLLASWPRLGRIRDDLRRGLRSFLAGNYIIFYRLQRRDVLILRVLHVRRDLSRIFAQE
jgi:toxin ParE1/3/4